MLTIDMLPASYGLAVWAEWSDGSRSYRMLFDGGIWYSYPALWRRILALRPSDRRFELVVCSHIDGDHIDGLIRLMDDYGPLGIKIRRTWFNGWPQIAEIPTLGVNQGEYLGALLAPKANSIGWRRDPIMVPDSGAPPSLDLAGGAQVTILSPFRPQLLALRDEWETVLKDGEPGDVEGAAERLADPKVQRRYRGLGGRPVLGEEEPAPEGLPVAGDNTVANNSSIAVLLEQGDSAVLIGGDADPDVLAEGLRRLLRQRRQQRLKVGAFVLPHHGSRHNVNDAMLSLVQAEHYLISTDGRVYGHPHREAIEAVLDHEKERPGNCTLAFNYASGQTWPWEDAEMRERLRYEVSFPEGNAVRI